MFLRNLGALLKGSWDLVTIGLSVRQLYLRLLLAPIEKILITVLTKSPEPE